VIISMVKSVRPRILQIVERHAKVIYGIVFDEWDAADAAAALAMQLKPRTLQIAGGAC
jgi:hypothetical protein